MAGFFFDIRTLFGAKHSGKYLSIILRELAIREPKTFTEIFQLPPGDRKDLTSGTVQVIKEWRFNNSAGKRRFADIALLKGGEPIFIAEVKEDDFKNPANTAQLSDYMELLRQSPSRPQFAHISRYSPAPNDQSILEKAANGQVKCYRYRDIVVGLSGNPLSQMLIGYFGDIGVTKYEMIDLVEERTELLFLIVQTLGFPHRNGLGRLHSQNAIVAAPSIIRRLFENLEFLGEWIKNSNQTLFKRKFAAKFTPLPKLDIKTLKGALNKLDDNDLTEPAVLPGDYGRFVKSGSLYFYSLGALSVQSPAAKNKKWLYCEIGFDLHVPVASERHDNGKAHAPVILTLCARIFGEGLNCEGVSRQIKEFPSELKAMKYFHDLLTEALGQALKADAARIHPALKKFKVPD